MILSVSDKVFFWRCSGSDGGADARGVPQGARHRTASGTTPWHAGERLRMGEHDQLADAPLARCLTNLLANLLGCVHILVNLAGMTLSLAGS